LKASNLHIECRKCGKKLDYVAPHVMSIHCGTDFWTQNGERRWKPTICMSCRSEVGRHAQRAQGKWRSYPEYSTSQEMEEERKAFHDLTKQAFQSGKK